MIWDVFVFLFWMWFAYGMVLSFMPEPTVPQVDEEWEECRRQAAEEVDDLDRTYQYPWR